MVRPLQITSKLPDIYYGWWIVGASASILVLHSGIWWYGFGVLFKPIAEEFGWSRAVTSAAFSIYFL